MCVWCAISGACAWKLKYRIIKISCFWRRIHMFWKSSLSFVQWPNHFLHSAPWRQKYHQCHYLHRTWGGLWHQCRDFARCVCVSVHILQDVWVSVHVTRWVSVQRLQGGCVPVDVLQGPWMSVHVARRVSACPWVASWVSVHVSQGGWVSVHMLQDGGVSVDVTRWMCHKVGACMQYLWVCACCCCYW